MTSLQERAAAWHAARFPACTAGDIGLKAQAELGEVADAILAGDGRDDSHPERAGRVAAESADVVVTLLALCGRFGHGDLLAAVNAKLAILETPGGRHPGCLPAVNHAQCAREAHDRSLPDPPYDQDEPKAPDGLLGCEACGRPVFYCANDERRHHVDSSPGCSLAGTPEDPGASAVVHRRVLTSNVPPPGGRYETAH